MFPIVQDYPEQDEYKMTYTVRGSSLRTESPHPAVQIHPLGSSVQVAIIGLKRQHVGAVGNWDSSPDEFKKVRYLRFTLYVLRRH